MRAIGRAPSRCDITLLTPPFFSVSTRDILQARDGGKNKRSHGRCDYYYFCSVTRSTTTTCTTASIFSHIYSFHWLDFGWSVTTPTGLWTTKGYGLGWGEGGAGHLLLGIFCTFSWIALSFLDTKRGTAEGTAGHVCRDLKRRQRRPQQKISEDRKTMQKHSGL